jgi:serine kinase of HPr protein (carbohydrate metabolism regulator)
MSDGVNVHGTAIVVGTTGLVFLGPSGSGKTAAALHCIARARERGLFSALIADDQVLLEGASGSIVARAPTAIEGLAEVRGSGIVAVETVPCAILHHAVRPVRPPFLDRIAPEGEGCELLPGHRLAVARLPIEDGYDCFDRLTLLLPFVLQN